MRLLLDTHAFLWLNSAPEKLSEKALQLCNDSANMLFLSRVSPREIRIKHIPSDLEPKVPLFCQTSNERCCRSEASPN